MRASSRRRRCAAAPVQAAASAATAAGVLAGRGRALGGPARLRGAAQRRARVVEPRERLVGEARRRARPAPRRPSRRARRTPRRSASTAPGSRSSARARARARRAGAGSRTRAASCPTRAARRGAWSRARRAVALERVERERLVVPPGAAEAQGGELAHARSQRVRRSRRRPLEHRAERALDRVAHREPEHGHQRVARQRAQPLERLAHLGPALRRAARRVERPPDVRRGTARRTAPETASACSRSCSTTSSATSAPAPSAVSSAPARESRGLGVLEAALAERPQQAERDRALEQVGAPVRAEALRQLLDADHLGRLVGERLARGAREAQQLLARAAAALEQPPDRLEVEAVVLERADQLEPRDVLGAVEARAAADLGRREQPARLVGAHVAHGHADAAGELVDRQLRPGVCGIGHGANDTRFHVTSIGVT